MKRRKFILGLASAVAAGWSAWPLNQRAQANSGHCTDTQANRSGLAKIVRSNSALGTTISITAFYNNVAQAKQAIDAAFDSIDQVEEVMSLYRPDSQLCQLNETGQLDNPHPDLVRILLLATRLSEQSNGAFDVTIQPLWNTYNKASLQGRAPSRIEIAAAMQKVDWRQVQISDNRIALNNTGSAITLNGIAQGFAADAASKTLASHGIRHALIDAGEIGTVGSHAQKPDWTIGIKHPRQAKEFLAFAALKDRCLATSGDYETHFSDDFSSHHLLDARTGHSPIELSSVSIAAPTATEADALSSAVFLLGLQKGQNLIEGMPRVDALFVTKTGRQVSTSNFPLAS